ncbi:phage holin family protein [Clostridium thermarum]|uniref:phage holin family protein n=1 Tax=Clostridium thermarum TaxID=1716543 RepID=UPI0013D185E5|nr:phage holin family protein [Clostridium thermarum]
MIEMYKSFNTLSVKLVISTVVSIFSPFKAELIILGIMIIMDTITGSIYAIRTRKFCSAGLRRGFKKILFYSLCIIVIRLLEIGIISLITTNLLTNLIISFLIINEAISSLENLTLLGVPLPFGLTNFIIKQIKNETVKELVLSGMNKHEYIYEINDMLNFNLPNIKDSNYKSMLEIKFNEWAQLLDYFDAQFKNIYSENNEILYFRVSTLINATIARIRDKWRAEGIPDSHINFFNEWHDPRVVKLRSNINEICTSDFDMEKKKSLIIEKFITALYQTLIDIQKADFFK